MSTFPGAFVPVAPPADGLRLAFAAARRRRNRKAGAGGAAGLLATVALLASTGGAGDRTLLQQEPLPPSSSTGGLGVVTGDGAPSAAPASTATPAADSAVEAASLSHRQGLGASTSQTAKQGGDGKPSSAHMLRAQGSTAVSGPMTRSSGYGLPTGSDVTCPARKQQERQGGLCTEVYASSSSTPSRMRITAQVCNVGTATELLTYATARELDVAVRHAGHEVWRWSLGRRFANAPHDLTVGAQKCIIWTTEWAQVDSHGAPVKAGSYDVIADFDADEVAGPDRHPSYPITISQQP